MRENEEEGKRKVTIRERRDHRKGVGSWGRERRKRKRRRKEKEKRKEKRKGKKKRMITTPRKTKKGKPKT